MKLHRLALAGIVVLLIVLSGCSNSSSWIFTELGYETRAPMNRYGVFDGRIDLDDRFFLNIRHGMEDVTEARLRNAWLEFPDTDSRKGDFIVDLEIVVNGVVIDKIRRVPSDRNGYLVIENDNKFNAIMERVLYDLSYGRKVYMNIVGTYGNANYDPLDFMVIKLGGEADVRVTRY